MILDIIPPESMLAQLGAEPGDRLAIDDDDGWALYRGEPTTSDAAPRIVVLRSLTDDEVEMLRITDEDVYEHDPSMPPQHLPTPRRTDVVRSLEDKAHAWMASGFTLPDFKRWTARGIYEPSVAAELRSAGVDPDLQRDFLAEHAEAMNDGSMSTTEFERLFKQD